MIVVEPFGPNYPALTAKVQQFRRSARDGLASLEREEIRAYGEQVHAAILALQQTELRRVSSGFGPPRCASGTSLSDGRDIHAAIQRQHRDTLQAICAKERRERTDEKWREMYLDAMKEKRERELFAIIKTPPVMPKRRLRVVEHAFA